MLSPITWLLSLIAIIGFILYSIVDKRDQEYEWIIGMWANNNEGKIMNVSKEIYKGDIYSIWNHEFRWEHKNPKEIVRKLENMNFERIGK